MSAGGAREEVSCFSERERRRDGVERTLGRRESRSLMRVGMMEKSSEDGGVSMDLLSREMSDGLRRDRRDIVKDSGKIRDKGSLSSCSTSVKEPFSTVQCQVCWDNAIGRTNLWMSQSRGIYTLTLYVGRPLCRAIAE